MPIIHTKYYYDEEKRPIGERLLVEGFKHIISHPFFENLKGDIYIKDKELLEKDGICIVDGKGSIYVNTSHRLSSGQWAFALAHCLLHLALGHIDEEKIYGHLLYAGEDGSRNIYGMNTVDTADMQDLYKSHPSNAPSAPSRLPSGAIASTYISPMRSSSLSWK